MKCDVIVIGGGAAGLMCAMEAGRRGRSVMVLEHAERLGKKILISGGGRCNFTNLAAGPENYLSANPHFCKSALARYRPADFIALVEKHGIAYHEKKLGQLFCDISSRQIVEMLQKECDAAHVEVRLNCHVQSIEKNVAFSVRTSVGTFECDSLVVATGGLSFRHESQRLVRQLVQNCWGRWGKFRWHVEHQRHRRTAGRRCDDGRNIVGARWILGQRRANARAATPRHQHSRAQYCSSVLGLDQYGFVANQQQSGNSQLGDLRGNHKQDKRNQ